MRRGGYEAGRVWSRSSQPFADIRCHVANQRPRQSSFPPSSTYRTDCKQLFDWGTIDPTAANVTFSQSEIRARELSPIK